MAHLIVFGGVIIALLVLRHLDVLVDRFTRKDP